MRFHRTSSTIKQFTLSMVTATALGLSGGLQADTKPFELNIQQQNLGSALMELGERAGVEVIIPQGVNINVVLSGIHGTYTLEAALTELLKDQNLAYQFTSDNTVVIKNATDSAEKETSSQTEIRARVIEEVIVTASKREQSLQDVSISITALGSEEIARRGLVGMADYLNSIPSVSVLDQGAGNTQVVIRGIAADPQLDARSGGGPTVGVYFGETSISGLSGTIGSHPDIKLVDIERVEVLRGPQGSLYGASSLAGTVRNIPRPPNLEKFEGELKAGYSNTARFGGGNTEFQGILNMPIVEDKFAIRAVGYRFDNSGIYENIGPNDSSVAAGIATFGAGSAENNDIGASEFVGGRISALLMPVPDLSINLTYNYQEIEQEGWPSTDLVLGKNTYRQRRYLISSPGIFEPRLSEEFDHKMNLINMTIEYDFGWANLLSSTSSVTSEFFSRRDIGLLFFGGIPFSQESSAESKAFAQEIRLATQLDGPFQVVAGMYFEEVRSPSSVWNGFGGDPAKNPFSQLNLAVGGGKTVTDQRAAFGEASYQLSDDLKLTVGGRIFSYDRTNISTTEASEFWVDDTTVLESDDSDVNWKAGLDYTPNDDTLLYASWSQGFRLGTPVGPNAVPSCDADNDGIYDGSNGISTGARQLDPDYVDNYELGGKFSFLDNRLQINAGIFQMNWDGIPVLIGFNAACGALLNAGEARSRGAEIEGSYAIGDNILFNIGASFVEAELTEDAPSIGLAGDRLPGAPKYNVNAGLQYEFWLAGYNAYARGDYYYVGAFYDNPREIGQELGDYGLFSMQFGVDINKINWEMFARNITNEDAYTWVDVDGSSNVGYQLRPRTIGVNFRYTF